MRYSRIISYLFFLLSASFFVCASPVGAPIANDIVERGGGNNEDEVIRIGLELKDKIVVFIPALADVLRSGGDPSPILADVSAAVDVSVTELLALEPDTSHDYSSAKKQQIITVFVGIIVDVVVVLGQLPLSLGLLTITAAVDIIFSKLLLALDAAIVGIVHFAAPLVTNIDLFVTLKFVLTLAAFGIIAV